MEILHPALAEHIAKWRAKRDKDLEERRRSEAPSTRRSWRVSADEEETIEIPQWAMEAAVESSVSKVEDEDGPRLILAPGCFGLATTFGIDAKECVPCPFHERCKPLAAQNLITVSTERANDTEFHQELKERRAHDRARNRKDKAKSRAKVKEKVSPKRHPIASVALTHATLADRKVKLVKWLAKDEPRSRQLREYQKEILVDYVVFQHERNRTGGDPGPTAFARALTSRTGQPMTTSSAQKRLARLCRLESAEGPWVDPRAD
jgi:hypothetical protein